jgi:tetratricopeptide (TPR) repeat protein
LYRTSGRPGDEVTLYQEAINRGVQNAWVFSRLGALNLRAGNRQDAITYLERAASADPTDHASLQHLAVAYRETGRIADAERVLHAILKSEEYAPAYNELGMAAFQKGEIAAARDYFEKAGQIDATYMLNLARLYRMAGEVGKARAAYEAFLEAAGNLPDYRNLVREARKELALIK